MSEKTSTDFQDSLGMSLRELEIELDLVAAMQRHIMPDSTRVECFADYEISGSTQPATVAGGDYYDFIDLEGRFNIMDKLGLVVADASGHGLAATMLIRDFNTALYMGISLQAHYEKETSPLLFTKVNRRMFRSSRPNQYISCFYGELHRNGTLHYTNAGHPSPLLFRGSDLVRLDVGGIVMGVFHKLVPYEIGEVRMEPGDLLVCFTDGITETRNPSGVEYQSERLIQLCRKHRDAGAQELCDIITEEVNRFRGGLEAVDDQTLVVVKKGNPC